MKKYIYFLCFTITVSFTNCSKYDDGPLISLRGKENRLVNSWSYTLVMRNGVNVMEGLVMGSINYTQSSIGFTKEGRFTEIYTIDAIAAQKDGDWSFDQNKQNIILNFDDESEQRNLRILKLKNTELWLEESFDDNTIEYQMMPNS